MISHCICSPQNPHHMTVYQQLSESRFVVSIDNIVLLTDGYWLCSLCLLTGCIPIVTITNNMCNLTMYSALVVVYTAYCAL